MVHLKDFSKVINIVSIPFVNEKIYMYMFKIQSDSKREVERDRRRDGDKKATSIC